MTQAIQIEGLTKTYGDFIAVDSLSLNISRNSFVGFLGPNGAGKSTTIKMLTNLTVATSGKAFLNGIDVVKDPKTALSEVGAVVETPEFYPYLTPDKSLEYIAKLRGMKKDDIVVRTKEVLDLVKMSHEHDMKIGKFSKGMKQRVAIAQALMFDPSIIILDEPTSGLDPRGMVEVREILLDLKKRDLTIFMSSHLLNEVQGLCDSVAMMNHGKLLLNKSIDDLKKELEYTRIQVDTIKHIDEAARSHLSENPCVGGVEVSAANQIIIEFKGGPEDRNDLLRRIDSELKVTSFFEHGNPLEEMYMGLIKESR
ncbi:MAG: ABC transporter ATP-binding protein [Methanomassiliicoccales archaeon]|nr:ABC transporter ATP-binding protein [Methanomassiliicoccales archaeon]